MQLSNYSQLSYMATGFSNMEAVPGFSNSGGTTRITLFAQIVGVQDFCCLLTYCDVVVMLIFVYVLLLF